LSSPTAPVPPSNLYIIDPSTGTSTLIGSMVNDFDCSALSVAGGTLYAGGEDATGVVSLFTVDTTTGVATEIGNSKQGACGSGHFMSDMTFSPGGTLFALFVSPGGAVSGVPCLGKLNPSTGVETDIGPATGMHQAGTGMGYDPLTTKLYATDLLNLYSLNTGTGAATVVGPLTGGVNGVGICSTVPFSPAPGITLPRAQPIEDLKTNAAGTIFGILNCGAGFLGPPPVNYLITLSTGGAITVVGQFMDGSGTAIQMDGLAFTDGVIITGVPEFPISTAGAIGLVVVLVPLLWLLRAKSGRLISA
jgi:hypothetical protein